ncbi:DUF3667 domain-containing protein [Marixanthomonas spongiae]|uniref:DUF3667 domain-containing protein n=1 Tax=Marixanthomonas spongiae TaxID=2174845 RepID=A0A2U0I7H1_9FLAO|nr:DUF3667 domain-containing protein [Marixanthomonas spongiae]PVW17041.1 hypothetical protein DDV96_00485 [Marixanthomonas spongiae]
MSKKNRLTSNSRKALKYRGDECLNCGQPLDKSDVYCPYCSQLNSTKPLSFKDFFAEFIGSIVTYDSRLRYTLKDLLFSPGTISKRYVKGERQKYANPFRFFLSVSIIYFILQSLIGIVFPEENNAFISNAEKGETTNEFYDNWRTINDQVKKASAQAKAIQDSIDESQKTDTLTHTTTTSGVDYISEASLDTLNWLKRNTKRFELYRDFYKKHDIKNARLALDSLNHSNTMYHRWLYNKNESIERVEDNPRAFLDYLFQKTPFFVFFFIPFYALFFWLIYSKRKYNYIDHTVFLFHLFSFLFLALIICLIPDTLMDREIFQSILISLIGPFYFYKALRNFYKQSRFITILKFVFLNIVFWIGATIAAVLFFGATAAVY